MSRYVVRVVERDGVERYAMRGALTDAQELASHYPLPSNAWQAADRMLAKFSKRSVYIDVIDTRDPESTVLRRPRNMKHGYAPRIREHPTYTVWHSMKRRCNDDNYKNYGGRGIRVCERWEKFENFLADMGERPKGKTLGRIDNNGNYCPENCRWELWTEQMRNTRRNNFVTFNGVTKILTDWANDLGIKPNSLRRRLKKWPLEKCFSFGPSRARSA